MSVVSKIGQAVGLKKFREVSPGSPLQPCSYYYKEWWTGRMVESVDFYPGFEIVDGKTEETTGRKVCLIPEVRRLPDLRKEKQFTCFYETKEGDEDSVVSRDQYFRLKGFMLLTEAPEEIRKMAAKMKKDNEEKLASAMTGGRQAYEPKKAS